MQIINKDELKKLHSSGKSPLINDISFSGYAKGLLNLIKEHGFHVGNTVGFEIGCGTGRSIFRLGTSYKMEAIEASKEVLLHRLSSSFYLHPYDFMSHDLNFLRNRYDFIIIDHLDVQKDEMEEFTKRIKLISKDKCLILFSGSKEEKDVIKSMKGLELHLEHNDMLDIYFEDKEYDYLQNNFTVFALGYDAYNPILKEEEEEEDISVDEKLDEGKTIKLDEKEIRKANKKELKIFYEAMKMEFDGTLKVKQLREALIKELGL
jgi:hypothetical protein